jgi:hypothetical protein
MPQAFVFLVNNAVVALIVGIFDRETTKTKKRARMKIFSLSQ